MREVVPRPRSLGERLDAIIGIFSPRMAAERAAWRAAERLSYRSARTGRTDRGPAVGGSADYHLEAGYDRDRILQRARQLERDNCIAAGILERAVDNIVGTGMVPRAATSSETFNRKAEALFAEWAEDPEARGLFDFDELQRATYLSYIRDGDVGTLKLGDGKLQAVEGDLIASPAGKPHLDNRMVDGVELDRRGRPVTYWLIDESGTETRNNAGRDHLPGTIPVDAARMLFLARRKRLGQTRGEPAFAQSAQLFDQVDGHIEAVVTAARMAACFGVMLRRPGGYGSGIPEITGSDGVARKDFRLEPGMVKTLEQGEEVTTLSPAQPTQNFPDFLAVLGRLLGLPFGLPLELVFLDFSKTNYSSARAALLQAYRRFRVEQRRFIAHWLRPIWRWKVEEWVREGVLTNAPEDWKKHIWTPPAWQWIDPKAEAEGHLIAIDAGFSTVAEVIAETGRDWRDVFAARKRELEEMKKAGMPEVRSNATRDPLPPAPAKDPAAKQAKRERQSAMQTAMAHVEKLTAEVERLRAETARPAAAVPGVTIHHAAPDAEKLAQPLAAAFERALEKTGAAMAAQVPAAAAAALAAAPPPAPIDMAPVAKAIDAAGARVADAVKAIPPWPEIPAPQVHVEPKVEVAPAQVVVPEGAIRVEVVSQPKTLTVTDARGNKITGTIKPS